MDLAKVSNDDLAGNATVRLTQGLLKAANEGTLLGWIEWAEPSLGAVPSEEALLVLIRYAIDTLGAKSKMSLREIAARLDSIKTPIAAKAIMSLTEQFRIEAKAEAKAEWLQKGLETGLQKGREEGLLRGTLIGQIQTLERLLKRAPTDLNELNRLEPDYLRALIVELERELEDR